MFDRYADGNGSKNALMFDPYADRNDEISLKGASKVRSKNCQTLVLMYEQFYRGDFFPYSRSTNVHNWIGPW